MVENLQEKKNLYYINALRLIINEKLKSWIFMKITNFCSDKYTFQNVKGQVTELEKIFANCVSNKYQEYISNSLNSTVKK